jgi:hypothetical protein
MWNYFLFEAICRYFPGEEVKTHIDMIAELHILHLKRVLNVLYLAGLAPDMYANYIEP